MKTAKKPIKKQLTTYVRPAVESQIRTLGAGRRWSIGITLEHLVEIGLSVIAKGEEQTHVRTTSE